MANPPLKIRRAIFFAVALFALAVRLPQLGERPMHTDEAVNAYLTGDLLAGESFHYDPQDRHGPGLFILAEPLAKMPAAVCLCLSASLHTRVTALARSWGDVSAVAEKNRETF